MLVRRCMLLHVEARETYRFDLGDLATGGTGVVATRAWIALAPHLEEEVALSEDELLALGRVPAHRARRFDELLAEGHAAAVLHGLLEKGLLLGDDGSHAPLYRREQALRDLHWWPAAAVAWSFGRWRGVDSVAAAGDGEGGLHASRELMDRLGTMPDEVVGRLPAAARLALPRPDCSALDALLARRTTCRNFDLRAELSQADFAAVMHRVFAVHGRHEVVPGAVVFKKTSPSGGGLHPLEAYLLVRRVQGVAPGLYHYHCLDHALEPLGGLADDAAAALAREFVAGQDWFADAPVLLAMTARFWRHQWKYRNHAKAFRTMNLEAGHFSQTLFLAAAELGLGAYVTAAINEHAIERAFGLDGLQDGPLAVCGFGPRAARMATFELDPARAVWPDGTR